MIEMGLNARICSAHVIISSQDLNVTITDEKVEFEEFCKSNGR